MIGIYLIFSQFFNQFIKQWNIYQIYRLKRATEFLNIFPRTAAINLKVAGFKTIEPAAFFDICIILFKEYDFDISTFECMLYIFFIFFI